MQTASFLARSLLLPARLQIIRPSPRRPLSTMSNTAPIPIEAASLREWVLSKTPQTTSSPKTFQIVDVRDDDYIGGHIPGTLNIPSRQFPSRVDALVDQLEDREAVVFTCALSQQRGPNVWCRRVLADLGCAKVLESG